MVSKYYGALKTSLPPVWAHYFINFTIFPSLEKVSNWSLILICLSSPGRTN